LPYLFKNKDCKGKGKREKCNAHHKKSAADRFQVPGSRSSGSKFQVANSRVDHTVSGANPISNPWNPNLKLGTWNLEPGTWNPLPHPLRFNPTTFSTCVVWGNISTGCTAVIS
jgi:hypothetical protein